MSDQQLTDRDMKILGFLARYRAATDLHIGKEAFDDNSDPNAVRNIDRVMRRLERKQLVKRVRCSDQLKYFVLKRRAFRLLGLRPRTVRSLTEQSLPVVLAIASYCVARGLKRMTHQEFLEDYPELWRPGLRSSSYVLVDRETSPKLELLLVDRGGAARRIRSRVRRVVGQRIGVPDFESLIEDGCFRITVLTGTPEQQAKIEYQIERESFAPIAVGTALVHELADLLLLRKN